MKLDHYQPDEVEAGRGDRPRVHQEAEDRLLDAEERVLEQNDKSEVRNIYFKKFFGSTWLMAT